MYKYTVFFSFLILFVINSCDQIDDPEPYDFGLEPEVTINVLNRVWKPEIISFGKSDESNIFSMRALDYDNRKGETEELTMRMTFENFDISFLEPFDTDTLKSEYDFRAEYSFLDKESNSFRWLALQKIAGRLIIENVSEIDGRYYYGGSFDIVVCNSDNQPGCHTITSEFEKISFFPIAAEATEYINQNLLKN